MTEEHQMGLIRKTMSVSTFGAVDFRSDKERVAAYARGTRKHARRQVKEIKKQNEMLANLGAQQGLTRPASGPTNRLAYQAPAPRDLPAVAYPAPADGKVGFHDSPREDGKKVFWSGTEWLF